MSVPFIMSEKEIKSHLKDAVGSVVHEICHAFYHNQETSKRDDIEKFFFRYPSPYAHFAALYLDEALATAIGNGVFIAKVYGKPSISYANEYIERFALHLFGLTRDYVLNDRSMDKDFWENLVLTFSNIYPGIYKNLNKVLTRYVVLSKDFAPDKVAELLNKHFRSLSTFHTTIDNREVINNIIKTSFYDCNAPIIFVLSEQEAANFKNFSSRNPYIQELYKYQNLSIRKGTYGFFSEKLHDRLYLFFTVKNMRDLEYLVKRLKKKNQIG